MNPAEPTRLSPDDADLLDRLLAGHSLAEVIDADEPNRAERVTRLLSLLDQWEASDPEAGLAQRALAGVLASSPVSLCKEDSEALDALLELQAQGLNDGPMPPGVRERATAVRNILNLLDQANEDTHGETVPTGLVERTMQRIEQDKQSQQQRTALSNMNIAGHRQGSIGIRQIATTAALLVMALSILLPMLSNAQRDARIAQCGQNLAGLGIDLQQIAFDHNGATHQPAKPQANTFNPLAKFAATNVDGSPIPASEAGFFVLLDQQRIASQHLSCPNASRNDPASLYNGQNPAAGGPFRVFLKARPIFADANPLYRNTDQGLVRNDEASDLSRSVNHSGAGQNVLISDGSVQWMIRPVVQRGESSSDNIWLYQPDNAADQDDDIFLTP